MPRAYTVAIAALALDVPYKWLDNVLSHHPVHGIERGRQGRQRRLEPHTLLVLAAARALHFELGIPIGRAVALAGDALAGWRPTALLDADRTRDRSAEAGGSERSTTAHDRGGIRLLFDVAMLRAALDARIREAVEFGAAPPRGRPPRPAPTLTNARKKRDGG